MENKEEPVIPGAKMYENISYPPTVPGNIKDHFEDIKNMEIRADDVFIATYPRSGTHWTYEIVRMLIAGKAEYNNDQETMVDFTPISAVSDLKSKRILATHLPCKYLPKDIEKCRVLYVTRNPKDVAISLHCLHLKRKGAYRKFSWQEFLQYHMNGKFLYGSWFDHVIDYHRFASDKENIQILKFEEMKKDLRASVKDIAEFLGVPFDESLIDGIAEACQFKSMKNEKDKNMTETVKALTTNPADNFHYRKGEVGDWKNHFTVAQNEQFNALYNERMGNTDLNFS